MATSVCVITWPFSIIYLIYVIFKHLFQHKIHEKIIYITVKGAGFLKESFKNSVFCLLSLAFFFSSFQAILYCQS